MTTSTDVEVMRRLEPIFVAAAERNLRWNYVVMAGDMATFAFAIALLSETTILPAFVKALTNEPAALGVLAAIFAFGHFAPQLLGAYLAMGRERQKPLVVAIAAAERVGIFLMAAAAQVWGLLPSETVLVLFLGAFAVYASTTGLIGPPYGDLLAKSIIRHRGRLFGVVQLLGGALGFGAAFLASQILRSMPAPSSFQVLLWLAFLLSFISLLFIAGFREVPFPSRRPRPSLTAMIESIPRLLRVERSYRWFLVGRSAIALGTMGLGFVSAAAIELGLSPSDVAGFASIYLLSQSVGGLGWGLLGDRMGWKVVLLGAGAALGCGMVAASLAREFLFFGLTFGLFGVANAGALVSDPNITYEIAPPGETSLYLGITSTVIAPALTVAPLIGALLQPLLGFQLLFAVSACLAAGGVLLALARFEEPRAGLHGMEISPPGP
jgi:MFS family permease